MLRKRLAAALIALACCTTAYTPLLAQELSLVRGNTGNPGTLDPARASLIEEYPIILDLFEGLTRMTADGNVAPGVAESWDVSEDGLTYTFHLRADAKWSNDTPVTANDFVFSIRRFFSPEVGGRFTNYLTAIKNAPAVIDGSMPTDQLGVAAVDDRTLAITLSEPLPYLTSLLALPSLVPLNEANIKEFGDGFTAPGKLVSNGAYTLTDNIPNDRVILDRNPTYYGAADVQVSRVTYIPFEDPEACVRRFEAKEVAACPALPTDTINSIRERFGDQVLIAPRLFSLYLHLNLRQPKLAQDVRIRQALSMAVDRDFLADEVMQGLADPSYAMVPDSVLNYPGGSPKPDWADLPMIDREDAAIALMKEAGFGPDKPLQLEIAYWTQAPGGRDLVAAVADMWAPLGVEVAFNQRDAAAHFEHLVSTSDYEVPLAGLISSYSDPSFHLAILTSTGTFNYAGYKNPEYDKLVLASGRENDPDKRADLMRQAEQLVINDMPTVTLVYPKSAELVSSTISGWEPNTLGIHPTRDIKVSQ